MKKSYKIILAVGVSTVMLASSLLLGATGENGDDTLYENHVYYDAYYEYSNSVETNLFANNLSGVVVRTAQSTLFEMFDYTATEEWENTPILYADEYTFPDDNNDDVLIQDVATKLGGDVLSYWTLAFFRGGEGDTTPITLLSQEIELCFQMNSSYILNGNTINAYDLGEYEFSVVRVHDGVATVLKDQDTNPYTLTVYTDRFSTYALVVSEPGEVDAYIATYQSGTSTTTEATVDTSVADTTTDTSSDLVLDSVPKTGER